VGHVTLTTPLLSVIYHLVLGLDIAYMLAKFDYLTFCHSGDMLVPTKIVMVHVT